MVDSLTKNAIPIGGMKEEQWKLRWKKVFYGREYVLLRKRF